MAREHHPDLFSHEWIELPPELMGKVKKYGVPLGIGALLLIAALSTVDLGAKLNTPLKLADVVDAAIGESLLPPTTTGYYLPDQFVAQEKQAKIEELPPQF
jgi:hypothetical protein